MSDVHLLFSLENPEALKKRGEGQGGMLAIVCLSICMHMYAVRRRIGIGGDLFSVGVT